MHAETVQKKFDLVVIGGGITGAGIFREAVRSGLQTLLVEQADFAWGTSSRSSKLVHGGLRYLKEGRLMLTHESVKERERLLKEAPGLVEPIDFMMPIFKDRGPAKWTMIAGLTIYDMMAKKWRHRFYRKKKFKAMEPMIDPNGLVGGFTFMDAQVDDARLVMRLINEAVEAGGIALNYTRAIKIKRDATGKVTGIVLKDRDSAKQMEVSAGAVINATGVWAEGLHPSPEKGTYIRPLRGSHLIFSQERVSLKRPVSFINPKDKRPLFAIPWEGAVLVGTTDIDHETALSVEPHISKGEAEYILNAMKSVFPLLDVDLTDCISTIAGVRPVLSKGKLDASQESREHAVWIEKGLVTVTGGKLTTFRALAWDTLKAATPFLNGVNLTGRKEPVFNRVDQSRVTTSKLNTAQVRRLFGRYGRKAEAIINHSNSADLDEIPGTWTLWAELSHTAAHEMVRHLDDLLLRRVRIGLLIKNGGQKHFDRIKSLCQTALKWDDTKWDREEELFLRLWKENYSIPT